MFSFSKIAAIALVVVSIAAAPAPINDQDGAPTSTSISDFIPNPQENDLNRRGVSAGLVMSGNGPNGGQTIVVAMKMLGSPAVFGMSTDILDIVLRNINDGISADIQQFFNEHVRSQLTGYYLWKNAVNNVMDSSITSNVALTAGSATAATATFTYRLTMQMGSRHVNQALRVAMVKAFKDFLTSKGITPRDALLRKRELQSQGKSARKGLVARSANACPAKNPVPKVYETVTDDPADPGDAGAVKFCALET